MDHYYDSNAVNMPTGCLGNNQIHMRPFSEPFQSLDRSAQQVPGDVLVQYTRPLMIYQYMACRRRATHAYGVLAEKYRLAGRKPS